MFVTESRYLPDLLGGLALEATAKGLSRIHFGPARVNDRPGPLIGRAEAQLREYFAGARFEFDLPLDLQGTAFQLAVWNALIDIPYASTASYRDIAIAVNRPRGFQAIGQANTRNPVPIVVPCHRVINADGSMGGYGGGPSRKRILLDLEQTHAYRFRETAA
ncbi:MAG: methylated-DNA--[protein]-cysteine S-methyltransferase [Acidobacteriota bacterium]|nr:methylated-DNA--[protein]-cysteine S-methyltransferase [Acidobacteriota bacterium]